MDANNIDYGLMIDFLSLIIASIGCVTGIISLIIVLIDNIFQVGKQHFETSNRRKSYYFNANDTETKGCYNVKLCSVVSIKATNRSSYPITIDEAYLKNSKNTAYHFNDFEYKYIEIKTSPTHTVGQDSEELATLPLKLEPFETKYLAFAFPYVDNFVNKCGEEIYTKLIVITPRKKYKLNISIPYYYNIFSTSFD